MGSACLRRQNKRQAPRGGGGGGAPDQASPLPRGYRRPFVAVGGAVSEKRRGLGPKEIHCVGLLCCAMLPRVGPLCSARQALHDDRNPTRARNQLAGWPATQFRFARTCPASCRRRRLRAAPAGRALLSGALPSDHLYNLFACDLKRRSRTLHSAVQPPQAAALPLLFCLTAGCRRRAASRHPQTMMATFRTRPCRLCRARQGSTAYTCMLCCQPPVPVASKLTSPLRLRPPSPTWAPPSAAPRAAPRRLAAPPAGCCARWPAAACGRRP